MFYISILPLIIMAITQIKCRYKHFTSYKSIEIGLKYTKMTKSKKTSKMCQIFDFRMEPKITMLSPICF